MTKVYGEIDSLKSLKEELYSNGITHFTSLNDIIEFPHSYTSEKQKIIKKVELGYVEDVNGLNKDRDILEKYKESVVRSTKRILDSSINQLKSKYDKLNALPINNSIKEAFYWWWMEILKYRMDFVKHNYNYLIHRKCDIANKRVERVEQKINYYANNRTLIMQRQIGIELTKLEHTKRIVDQLGPLIAGAIGEHKVEKALSRLYGNNFLINNYSINFNPPLIHRKEHGKIFSIQADHLLITNAGVFNIETKNWSEKSIRDLNLRSPIKQVRRTGHALWIILNRDSNRRGLKLNYHHWGQKEIPIYNIIVMINNKPAGKFQFVDIITLDELNRHLTKFKTILEDNEVKKITEYLRTFQLNDSGFN